MSIAVISATGRYETAIILPRDDERAANLVALGFLLACITSAIIALAILVAGDDVTRLLSRPEIRSWLLLLPFSLALAAATHVMSYWAIRKKSFFRLSASRLMQAVTSAVVSVCLAFYGFETTGLIAAQIVGQGVAAVTLLIGVLPMITGSVSLRVVREVAYRYRDFPKFMTWSSLLGVLSAHMPILLLGVFYNPLTVGYYALAYRVIRTPLIVMTNAVGDVFKQAAASDMERIGSASLVFRKTALRLAAIAVPIVIILAFKGPLLFVVVFGEEWATAGLFAQIMSVMCGLQLIVSPLSMMFMIAEKQRQDLFLQVGLIIAVILAIWLGYLWGTTATLSIILFSTVYSIKYVVQGIMSYVFAAGNRRVSVDSEGR